jgi:hypothetical protein
MKRNRYRIVISKVWVGWFAAWLREKKFPWAAVPRMVNSIPSPVTSISGGDPRV